MKKLLSFLFLGACATVSAQSFSIYITANGVNTQTVMNGDVVNESTTINSTTETSVKIKNNAASTQTFNVVRSIVYNNPAFINNNSTSTPNTYFCFGYNCFSSAVNTAGPGDYTILAASGQTSTTFPYADNSSANNQPFKVYVDEGATQGQYTVRYKVFNVNNANDTLSFMVSYNNAPVSVKENRSALLSLEVYPNPASDLIRVVAANASPAMIQIYNALGQLVISADMESLSGAQVASLNTSALPAGVYELRVISGGSSAAKKIMIQH